MSLSFLALLFCKDISGWLVNYDRENWFAYFTIVERSSILLLLISGHDYFKKKCWIIFELLLLFLMQDFIDRVFFDIKVWNINDTIGIGLIGFQVIVKVIKNDRIQT